MFNFIINYYFELHIRNQILYTLLYVLYEENPLVYAIIKNISRQTYNCDFKIHFIDFLHASYSFWDKVVY